MSQRALTATRMPRLISGRPGIWRLVLLVIILLAVIGYVSPIRDYVEKSRMIASERSATEELQRQNKQLLGEKESLLSNDYVERIARKDLGMVRPGEQPFVVRDLEKEDPSSTLAGSSEEENSFMDRLIETVTSLLP